MAAFPTTRWSLIHASRQSPQETAAAWAALVRDYRPAIVAYFRRSALARDAEDLAQEFLLRSMQADWWARADAEIGSFRRFLLALLKRFLLNRESSAMQRREVGGDALDALETGGDAETPEACFDLQFALCLTRTALHGLRERYAREGRADLFAGLEPWLAETPAHGELAALATRLQVAPNTLAVNLRRLRQRLQEGIRAALAELCLERAQVDADLAALREALARTP
ncbi:sigma factor [Tahibacter caeni]|uniref:sigma factor n=1 Tax=Tahibacter caeni TaxID=1453545 RepID=UPI002148CF21|nr:sigma factor [Tahibacter caeni]